MDGIERENGELPASQRGLLRVNRWGAPLVWVFPILFALVAVIAFINWLTRGESRELQTFLGFSFLALSFGRIAALGLEVKNGGVRVRSFLRTYHLRWDEIECFELRGTVYTPSLRVRLRDGTERGIVGLAARTAGEKERATQIFAELNRRLEIEQRSAAA
jgi:Bacterial PH domain